jgi:hypothetical protein
MQWMDKARCKDGAEMALFDAIVEDDNARIAPSQCYGCTVIHQCLAYGTVHGAYGYWGGVRRKYRMSLKEDTILLFYEEVITRREFDKAFMMKNTSYDLDQERRLRSILGFATSTKRKKPDFLALVRSFRKTA